MRAWRLTAYTRAGTEGGGEPSCGPVLWTFVNTRRAELADLTGRSFQSVSIRGIKLVKEITLSFETKLVDHDNNWDTPNRRENTLTANTGCNTLSGRYWLKDGRLIWSRKLVGTKTGCPNKGDQWLMRTLQKGVSARIVKGQLVLTGKRGTKIVLATSP